MLQGPLFIQSIISMKAVFMPYLASMWDALEGVWMGYDKDPAWETTVVPIPYYERNPDRSFGQLHYEGERFPEYVPVVPYETYDLEKEHPDVIYIHNPYDDINLVTSVHPDYYSAALKKHTDKLVYIPYFVHVRPDPSDSVFLNDIYRLAHTPAVYHADETIVQSETVRRCYIDALVQTDGEQSREKWERKIINGGSPKLKKAAHIREMHYEYPQEWLSRIYKEDGTRKKVYFFNTTISALLQQDEAQLAVIENVFRLFERFRESTVLLWRPHPLLEATIHAMRPHLAEKYHQLVEKFKSDGTGIFDDSPDMYMAISLSDTYFGDRSSLVEIFEAAGIPVILRKADDTEQQGR